ncbi:molybdate ABC transporter substrate-binding protein [Tautonia sociabilis]|uniref:molybdate ABC transporter substrate-binding protein n=1 Tax=Tautonia sociabilis TaxID=2080755 RepID=UPI0013159D20|nr:molybdate ABC transporter substrate-binding protein [Tautonia sociabilis]
MGIDQESPRPGSSRPRCWLAAIALIVAGCSDAEPGAGPGPVPELRVAAASDLVAAMPELVSAFERQTGVRVVPVFGSSGLLARQIEQGAPFDVFLSANETYVRHLAEAGAIEPESVRTYALGYLVLAFPGAGDAELSGLEALADPRIRGIALANPEHAPYGRAGRQALERSGLWEAVEGKVVFGQSIQQATRFVESGQVDAGLIARSLVDSPAFRWEPVDPGLHDPIAQYLGIVSNRPSRESAAAFCDLLLSEPGQAILARFGFQRPPEEDAGTPGG